MLPVAFALVGLAFGSFLNVVIQRVPQRRSVVSPASACPHCGIPIRPRDNIPILSYVLLGGRCRACRVAISAEYPVVEALVGALFVATAILVRPPAVAALVAPFLGIMLAVAVIDIRHRIIPNRVVYPSVVVFGLGVLIVWAAGGGVGPARAGLGLLAYGGALLVIALVSPSGMGMGDVKLAALIGLVLGALGWSHVAVAAAVAVFAGGLGGLIALLVGRGRKDAIPFGPYLALGAVVSAFFATPIADWYRGLLGPVGPA